MIATVYHSKEEISCSFHFYPDLKYHRGELYGKERILKYVSLYVQDKICICDLLKLHRYLLLADKLQKFKDNKRFNHELSELNDNLLSV